MTDRHSPAAVLDTGTLVDAGFTLHAIFDLHALPEGIRSDLQDLMQGQDYTQLLVFAHAGNALWTAMQTQSAENNTSEHPIDDYSRQQITRFLQQQQAVLDYQIIYPVRSHGTALSTGHGLDLQSLGRLAGWHHDSPLKVGIHAKFGTWFAYRLVVLCNSRFITTETQTSLSPCQRCESRPCINHCPADAVSVEGFDLNACIGYRRKPTSRCKTQCLSRIACPIGKAYQYSPEQMNYYYARSMQTIDANLPE